MYRWLKTTRLAPPPPSQLPPPARCQPSPEPCQMTLLIRPQIRLQPQRHPGEARSLATNACQRKNQTAKFRGKTERPRTAVTPRCQSLSELPQLPIKRISGVKMPRTARGRAIRATPAGRHRKSRHTSPPPKSGYGRGQPRPARHEAIRPAQPSPRQVL